MTDTDNGLVAKRPWRKRRVLVAASFAGAIGLLTTGGVYAALTATATGSEAVSSGTLLLTLNPDVGVGFSNFTALMAPGDVDNVFVNINNTGSLAGLAGLTLGVTGTPSNELTNNSAPGEGLSVTLTKCTVAWTLATGVCSGTPSTLMAITPISTLSTTPGSIASAALIPVTGTIAHVEVSLSLAGTETSTNGTLPSPTIQGLSTTLTYTFTELQRVAATTNQ